MLTIHVDKTKSVKQFAQQTLVAQWGVATVSDQKTKTATSDFVWYTTQLYAAGNCATWFSVFSPDSYHGLSQHFYRFVISCIMIGNTKHQHYQRLLLSALPILYLIKIKKLNNRIKTEVTFIISVIIIRE